MNRLVVEAKKLGIALDELLASMSSHWRRLGSNESMATKSRVQRKLLIRTMSLDDVPRATTSCLPSGDQSKE
jgi:hypothetical protein